MLDDALRLFLAVNPSVVTCCLFVATEDREQHVPKVFVHASAHGSFNTIRVMKTVAAPPRMRCIPSPVTQRSIVEVGVAVLSTIQGKLESEFPKGEAD